MMIAFLLESVDNAMVVYNCINDMVNVRTSCCGQINGGIGDGQYAKWSSRHCDGYRTL